MKRNMLLLVFTVVAGGSVAAILMSCVGLGPFAPQGITPGMRSDFGLMAEAWNTIQRYYVDRSAIQPGRLTYGAIGGMVEAWLQIEAIPLESGGFVFQPEGIRPGFPPCP